MSPSSLADQLDDAVSALFRDAAPAATGAESGIASLYTVAADLRGLPSEAFRQRLAAALAAPEPKAPEHQSLTLYLIVRRAEELLEFLKGAFGAVETLRATGSTGGMHAEVRIGSSKVMVGGYEGLPAETPATIHLYVENADAVYRRALEAGATSTQEPVDQPYGDREAGVVDPFGNHWYIATHAGAEPIPEGLGSVTPFLHPRGAARLIDFLRQAFGAEEVSRFQSPDGVIRHAAVRIGDSIIEMGEAHGPYQPMPPTFYLSVPDVDARFARALAEGATAIQAPADQAYGARTAGVKDPFDNVWYIAAPIGQAKA